MWRIFLSMSGVSLYSVYHLLVKQVRWKAVDVVVRTFGDLATFRATQRSTALLSQPTFQTGFAKCMKAFQNLRIFDFTELLLAHWTFYFLLDIIKKAFTLSHGFQQGKRTYTLELMLDIILGKAEVLSPSTYTSAKDLSAYLNVSLRTPAGYFTDTHYNGQNH